MNNMVIYVFSFLNFSAKLVIPSIQRLARCRFLAFSEMQTFACFRSLTRVSLRSGHRQYSWCQGEYRLQVDGLLTGPL